MNIIIRRIIYILVFMSAGIQANAYAVEMKTSCVDETVFNGKVCVHQANEDKDNTIVLVHGLNDDAGKNWSSQINALSQYFHVVAIDLPGFQFSEQGGKKYSPEKYVELINFITGRFDLEKFDLLGHSMGGAVSVLYAATYPAKVKKLVLVDVAGILHRLALGKSFIAFMLSFYGEDTSKLETYAAKIMMKYDWLYSIFRGEIARQNGQSRAIIEMLDYDYSSALDRIRSDTLIIWGEQDEVAPLRAARVLHKRIENSSLEVFEGVSHSPMIQKPSQFNVIMLSFLQDNYPKRKQDRLVKEAGLKELGVCKGETGKRFSGRYKKLAIQNCSNVE
ncbi:alpha/beta fold hydrolase, partial [Kaarinaea lacus]